GADGGRRRRAERPRPGRRGAARRRARRGVREPPRRRDAAPVRARRQSVAPPSRVPVRRLAAAAARARVRPDGAGLHAFARASGAEPRGSGGPGAAARARRRRRLRAAHGRVGRRPPRRPHGRLRSHAPGFRARTRDRERRACAVDPRRRPPGGRRRARRRRARGVADVGGAGGARRRRGAARAPDAPRPPLPSTRLDSPTMARAKRFPDRDAIASVRAEAEPLENGATAPTSRRLAGRVMARRDMGKLVFLDLVDRSGRIQLLCPVERTGEVDVHLGDVVGVSGAPAKSRRGEPSLQVESLEVLSRIRTPLPDTFHGLTDVEQRYRKRYLDLLMNDESRRDALIRSGMVATIRRILDEWGFVEVETPVLQPRYGGAFATPFVTHWNDLDEDRYLRIATELYLKRLIVGGLEK